MRKVAGLLGLMSLLAATMGALAAPAVAADYPPTACSLELAGGAVITAGGPLGITGSGFAAGEDVPLTANGVPVGNTAASETGTISTTITIPADASSPLVIAAPRCAISFELGATVPAQARALAFTGSNSSPLVVIGIVAVVLGTVLIFGARRRGSTRAAAEAARTTP